MSSNMSSSDSDGKKPGTSSTMTSEPKKEQNKIPVQKQYLSKSRGKNQKVRAHTNHTNRGVQQPKLSTPSEKPSTTGQTDSQTDSQTVAPNIQSSVKTNQVLKQPSGKAQGVRPNRQLGQKSTKIKSQTSRHTSSKSTLSEILAQKNKETVEKEDLDNTSDVEEDEDIQTNHEHANEADENNETDDIDTVMNAMFGRSDNTDGSKDSDRNKKSVKLERRPGQGQMQNGFTQNQGIQTGSIFTPSFNQPTFNQPSQIGQIRPGSSYSLPFTQHYMPTQFYNESHHTGSMGGMGGMSSGMNGFLPSPSTSNQQILSMIKEVADRVDSLTMGINGNNMANQQLMRAQSEVTNMMINQISRLMTQNDEMYNAVRSLRNELDTLRRSISDGFIGVEKDLNVLQRRVIRRLDRQNPDEEVDVVPSQMGPQPPLHMYGSRGAQHAQHIPPQRGSISVRPPIHPNFMMDPNSTAGTNSPNVPHATISITPISSTNPLFRPSNLPKQRSKEDEKRAQKIADLKKSNDSKKPSRTQRPTPQVVQNGGPGMIPLIIVSELMKMAKDGGDDDDEKENNDDVFKEVQIPNMERDLYKTGHESELENFEQLTFNNLDDFKKQGEKFIDAINKHNEEVDEANKKREKLTKTVARTKKSQKENRSDKSESDDEESSDRGTMMEDLENEFVVQLFANMLGIPREAIIGIEDTNPDDDSVPIKITTRESATDDNDEQTNKSTKMSKRSVLKKKMSIDTEIPKDKDGLYTFMNKRYSVDPRKLMKLVKPIQLLNSMIGMTEVKEELFKFISNFLYNGRNNGMLNTAIYGKPGIGKTDLGKILCMIYSALELVPSTKFKLVKASELIGQYVGQTRQKTRRVLEEADGGVLFIDEAYALTSGSGEKGALYGKECIDTINQELSENRRKLIVIIAGYENEIKEGFFKINQGLERRFPFRYVLKDYTKEEMKDIFVRMLRLNNEVHLYRDPKDVVKQQSSAVVPPQVSESKQQSTLSESSSENAPKENKDAPIDTDSKDPVLNEKSNMPVEKPSDPEVKSPSEVPDKTVESAGATDSAKPKQKRTKRDPNVRVPLTGSVTEKDIMDMFEDMRYFNNCGGDIENLITHIGFANSERTIGKHPGAKNVYTREDLRRGLESFKKHKAQVEDETWRRMFI
ncbi:stage V sporulation protein K [Yasminevirus sp. GU-2018]|uniref:Stage V sporulation protein K n=1 Tax=Yasminevirus sp. GU-2018 TaxID=2420051 RepID=A0A5K0U9L1_9VIRU|nr:stage V sporulation protein K [Yasminevirus sp. GU-2018]